MCILERKRGGGSTTYGQDCSSEAHFALFQVVWRAAVATAVFTGIGAIITAFRITKKDLKLF